MEKPTTYRVKKMVLRNVFALAFSVYIFFCTSYCAYAGLIIANSAPGNTYAYENAKRNMVELNNIAELNSRRIFNFNKESGKRQRKRETKNIKITQNVKSKNSPVKSKMDSGIEKLGPAKAASGFGFCSKKSKQWILSALNLNQKFLGIHGYVETRHYLDTVKHNDFESYYEFHNNFRLSKELQFTPNLSGKASMDGRLFYSLSEDDGLYNTVAKIKPWEIYLDYSNDTFDVRVGQQIIRWGKSDEVNPTDVFTPEDLSEGFNKIQRAKRKLPIIAAKIDYFHEDFQIEGIWLPFFVKTRLDETGGDWEPFLYRLYHSNSFTFLDDRGPPRQLKSSSFAFKLKKQTTTFDASLSYSYHFAQTAALELQPFTTQVAGVPVQSAFVESVFPRQHTIGGDFETTLGRLGVRAEWAYTTNMSFLSYDPQITRATVNKDALNYVMGIDYTYLDNLYLNLQYAQQFIFSYSDMMQTQQLEDSVVWRITKDFWHEKLTFKTTGRYFLSTGDALFQFASDYDMSDDINVECGYHYFLGEENTNLFGQYRRNDQLYTRIKYSF